MAVPATHQPVALEPVQSDPGVWTAGVRCACGWAAEGKAATKVAAKAEAERRGRSHALDPSDAPTATTRAAESAAAALIATGGAAKNGLMTLAALVAVAAVLAIPVVIVAGLGGSDRDDPQPAKPSRVEDPGSGIDCEKAVTTQMEREYGGVWGSGKWPTGEYPRRVKRCQKG
ncbi:hypothetical protein GCM10009623_34480 [Nocardioides aestuarii]|uniref:Uncharacterized protein n=1 Tax=Nocardioides aestuarii TaxID=252231 RepID=A0ABW4TPU0_9ACTN